MIRQEVALLLAKATAAYPRKSPDFNLNPQIFELWVERLENVDPGKALRNLNKHIDSSNWFPDISDIIGGSEQVPDVQETRIYLQEQAQQLRIATPPPLLLKGALPWNKDSE